MTNLLLLLSNTLLLLLLLSYIQVDTYISIELTSTNLLRNPIQTFIFRFGSRLFYYFATCPSKILFLVIFFLFVFCENHKFKLIQLREIVFVVDASRKVEISTLIK